MSSEGEVLTLRELSRATLARQMLLRRENVSALEAVERLAGMQAQVAGPPHVGLWSRLEGFRREDLLRLVVERRVVRATLMRATIHLVSAADYRTFRPALQSALDRSLKSACGKRLEGLDPERLIEAARACLKEGPRTFAALRPVLSNAEPDRDPSALAYAVRTRLPLVQVPESPSSESLWGYSANAPFALAQAWLGEPLASAEGSEGLEGLTLRYLAAFGPASVADFQAWSGLVGMKETFEELRSRLRTFRDERGRELFDLPDTPRPGADTFAPVRFLPLFDNLLLAHADRSRVISDERRKRIVTKNGLVKATFLVEGFVCGEWKVEKSRSAAALVIETFQPISKEVRDALAEEGERLVRFVRPDAPAFEVRFAGSG